MKHMNHYGSRRSKIHIRTVVVTYTMANIGIVRVRVIGHDVQTYFSLYKYLIRHNTQYRKVRIV